MKTLFFRAIRMGKFVTLVLGATVLAVSASAQTNVARTATVLHVQGKARFSTDHRTWQPVKKGSTIMAGALIQTAGDSILDLRISDINPAYATQSTETNLLRLFPNSVLAIDQLNSTGSGAEDTELTLAAGQISGRVAKLADASNYEIKFSTGIAGIREGAYSLASSGLLDVISGDAVVALTAPGNPVQIIKAGHRFDPVANAITLIPASVSVPIPTGKESSMPKSTPAVAPVNPVGWQGNGGALRKF
jgi:hypothetical protein